MSFRKHLVCDGCQKAVVHDPEKSSLPQGWWRFECQNASGNLIDRHWCSDCYYVATKAVHGHNAKEHNNGQAE